jgi:hypothetical protein
VLAVLFLPNDREQTKPRDLDLVGLALLSPGLVLFLYGSNHIRDRIGIVSLVGSILLLVAFFRWATRRKDKALIDLRLFKGKVFSASAVTQFMSNGISFAGQMLISIFLIRVGGRSPSATGLLLAPLGLGMMCGYPFVGTWVKWFGNRKVSAGGASLALAGTLPIIYIQICRESNHNRLYRRLFLDHGSRHYYTTTPVRKCREHNARDIELADQERQAAQTAGRSSERRQ